MKSIPLEEAVAPMRRPRGRKPAGARIIGPAKSLEERVARYGGPVPRYTSYPTALHFTPVSGGAGVVQGLRQNEAVSRRELGLYVHIPYCQERCWYCGCNALPAAGEARMDEYLSALDREMAIVQAAAPTERPRVTLHWGGGTPNLLTPAQIERLQASIERHYPAAKQTSFSVELDPRGLEESKIEAFARAGCNRVSLGVQDTNPQVQQAIHRIQPQSLNLKAVAWLRAAGIAAINIDLVYGFPLQTEATMQRTIEDTLALKPSRVALFGYAHLPQRLPAQRLLERAGPLPDALGRVRLFQCAADLLAAAGYQRIGLDHFALPDDPLAVAAREDQLWRDFQGYSDRQPVDLRAFGLSAVSQTANRYFQNHRDLAAYRQAVDSGRPAWARDCVLTPEDSDRRAIIMGIMTRFDYNDDHLIERGVEHPMVYRRAVRPVLERMHHDGLIVLNSAGFSVTQHGRFFLRRIASVFDTRKSESSQHSPGV